MDPSVNRLSKPRRSVFVILHVTSSHASPHPVDVAPRRQCRSVMRRRPSDEFDSDLRRQIEQILPAQDASVASVATSVIAACKAIPMTTRLSLLLASAMTSPSSLLRKPVAFLRLDSRVVRF